MTLNINPTLINHPVLYQIAAKLINIVDILINTVVVIEALIDSFEIE